MIQHDFLVTNVFREPVKGLAILDGPLIQVTLVINSQLLVLYLVRSLPSIECIMQIALHKLCSL